MHICSKSKAVKDLPPVRVTLPMQKPFSVFSQGIVATGNKEAFSESFLRQKTGTENLSLYTHKVSSKARFTPIITVMFRYRSSNINLYSAIAVSQTQLWHYINLFHTSDNGTGSEL